MTRIYHIEVDRSADMEFLDGTAGPILILNKSTTGKELMRLVPVFRFDKKCICCRICNSVSLLLQTKGKTEKIMVNFLAVYLKHQEPERVIALKNSIAEFSTAADKWFARHQDASVDGK